MHSYCTMVRAKPAARIRKHDAKNMSKKVQLIMGIAWVLLVLGGYLYYRHREDRRPVIGRPPEPAAKREAATPTVTATPPAGKEANEAVVKRPPAAEVLPVLRAGETLEYAANISKLNSTVASLKIVVGEQKTLAGKPTWHLQAFAHTENPYRMVFELDDQFDSYSERGPLTSMQYEMHLSERGQKVDSVQRMLPSNKEAAPAGLTAARVLPGTRDPLGMLHYLRNVDWEKTPEVRSPVYDGRKLYDVRARRINKSEIVTVPAGKYYASKIELRVLDNGAEMKDAHFLLYLANDDAKTPVLVEAVLPIATARVELTKVK
jgi:hypothetical protein